MAVPASPPSMRLNIEQYMNLPPSDERTELVRGELRVTPPPGAPHAVAASNLVILLGIHARQQGLGRVFGDSTGYELVRLPHTVRVPDASFVRAGRLPPQGVGPGLLRLAPDLAVEVLSPSETATELEEKLEDYVAAGTPLIWVVDPARRTVMTVATNAPVRWLREGDTLDGGAVIDGFECAVADIFDGIARTEAHDDAGE